MKKEYIVFLALVIVAFVFLIWSMRKDASPSNQQVVTDADTSTIISESDLGDRIISIDGGYRYESPRYGFQFTYPEGWYSKARTATNPSIFIHNYDDAFRTANQGKLPRDFIKIELDVVDKKFATSTDNDYLEISRTTTDIAIDGEQAKRTVIDTVYKDGSFGSWILSYELPLPEISNKTFFMTLYGFNLDSLSTLDSIIETLEWIPVEE